MYPATVKTLPDQLEPAGFTWKGYMEDLDRDADARRSPDLHAGRIGQGDQTEQRPRGDQYAAKHDPFVYFHTILDNPARCAAHIVKLSELAIDLRRIATTPNYSFITPNLCNDGHDLRCVDGRPGDWSAINRFLEKWVPAITALTGVPQGWPAHHHVR